MTVTPSFTDILENSLGHRKRCHPSITFDRSQIFRRGRQDGKLSKHMWTISGNEHQLTKIVAAGGFSVFRTVAASGGHYKKTRTDSLSIPASNNQRKLLKNLLHRTIHFTRKSDCYESCYAFN